MIEQCTWQHSTRVARQLVEGIYYAHEKVIVPQTMCQHEGVLKGVKRIDTALPLRAWKNGSTAYSKYYSCYC